MARACPAPTRATTTSRRVADTTADITVLAVTVTANNVSKVEGTADPALTATPNPALAPGDSFSGEMTRTAGEAVGTYPITQGTLALSANYDMTFVPGTFTITAAADFFPVWRFRQLGKAGSYLWTSDPAENANIQANLKKSWQYEGVAFNINRANPLNVNTLWRFRNLKTGSYLYTADPAEKANIEATLSKTWKYEGPTWNVSLTQTATPVWRFRYLKGSTYLWTMDPNEKLTIETTLKSTYKLEGIAYYVGQ